MQRDYAKLFLSTIINGESQTLLLRFFLRGGGGCTQATRETIDGDFISQKIFLATNFDGRCVLQ